jgi:F-type H+-transporting ATPase subunit b
MDYWFTFIAQIVNFLILILLMKKFLYGPIINAMEQREENIAKRMEEAEASIQRAEREQHKHRQLADALEQKKDEILHEASDEADQRRKKLMEQVRKDVNAAEKSWRSALEREKTVFLKNVRERAGQETIEIARKALQQLADDQLEERVVKRFIEQMDAINDERWDELIEYARESEHGLVIYTAFGLEDALRQELIERIHQKTGSGVSVSFERDENLITGIELRSPGIKIAWSMDDYIDELQQTLAEIVEQEAVS